MVKFTPNVNKMNVILRDGKIIWGSDIPQKPFGDNHRIVSFFEGEYLVVIPMDLVERVELFESKK